MALKLQGKHALADFLNDTFAIVPRIWKHVLPISFAALLPGSALMVAAIASLVDFVDAVIADGEVFKDRPSLVFSSLAPFLGLCVLAVIALYLGRSFQKAYVCAEVGDTIEGRRTPFAETLRRTARPAFVRVLVQDAILESLSASIVLGVVGALFLPILFGMIGTLVDIGESGASSFGAVFTLMAAYFVVILIAAAAAWWFKVKTAVSAPAAVLERVNSLSGMGRSLDLVRGRGWRIFGTMFIVSLVISFGLGVLTGPVTFVVILPGYFSILKETLAGNSPSARSIVAFLSSTSWAIGLSTLIAGVVEGSLWPSFLTLLHADLRIRAGEKEPMPDDEPPAVSSVAAGDEPLV
jgi:hypothetical protein